jgi:outer membrane protein assembly factor BamB
VSASIRRSVGGLILAAVLLTFTLAFPKQAAAQLASSPWPMLNHDVRHTGLSSVDTSAIVTPKWTFNQMCCGNTSDSPAVATDGTIYVGDGGSLWAVNPGGTEKWRYYPGNGAVAGIYGSPALGSDGTIYVGYYRIQSTGVGGWITSAGCGRHDLYRV